MSALSGTREDVGWEAIYNEAAPRLYGFFYSYSSGDVALAEDLVQETFVSAIKSNVHFDAEGGDYWPLLWRIARRRLADALRKQYGKSHPLSFEETESALSRACDSRPLPPEILQRKETHLRIGSALAALSETHRAVLKLRYYDCRSVKELATELHRSEKAAESLLARAREAFRSQFMETANDEEEVT